MLIFIVLCLALPTSKVHSTSVSFITPLEEDHGIVRTTEGNLDFPDSLWILRLQLPWSTWETKFEETATTVKYLSRAATEVGANLPDIDKNRVNELSGYVQHMKNSFAKAKSLAAQASFIQIHSSLHLSKTELDTYATWINPPASSNQGTDSAKQIVFINLPSQVKLDAYVDLSTLVPAITSTTKDSLYSTASHWPAFLDACLTRVILFWNLANDLVNDMISLKNGQIPPTFLPFSTLQPIVKELRKKHSLTLSTSEETDINRLYTFPLTFVTSNDQKTEIYLLYFLTPVSNRYSLQTLRSMPIHIQEDEGLWRKIVLTQFQFLVNDANSWEIKSGMYDCLKTDVNIVPLCFFKEIPSQALDQCTHAILKKKDILNNCQVSETKEIFPTAIKISKNKWTYSTNKPSVLKEKCNDTTGVVSMTLPNSGIITLNQLCTYEFVNGPFVSNNPFVFGAKYEITSGYLFPAAPNSAHPIEDHFKRHMYIYVLVLLSIVVLICFILICCYIKFRNPGNNVRRQTSTQDVDLGTLAANVFMSEFQRRMAPSSSAAVPMIEFRRSP